MSQTPITDGDELSLERCPHCGIHKPHLIRIYSNSTENHKKLNERFWSLFRCVSCGGVVLTVRYKSSAAIVQFWPPSESVSASVPERARTFLSQAMESIHSPAGAVMLTASSVDAMLKAKGYKTGVLNDRIKKAAADGLITGEMAQWAHEVRLDANDQRHADENAPLPNEADAMKSIEFAKALAQFLFVLPDMVTRGRTMPAGRVSLASGAAGPHKTKAPRPPTPVGR